MLNFQPLRDKTVTLTEFVAGLSKSDLAALTNEMVDRMLALIATCTDGDVTFLPQDPAANDRYAGDPAEVNMAWTLGHVIVHATASAEEAAFLAAELGRGVASHGRSRAETPWQNVTTIAACRARLEESRRMRLALLDAWPDEPHLELLAETIPGRPPVNAKGRFIGGLMHDDSHLAQIAEIVRQAHSA